MWYDATQSPNSPPVTSLKCVIVQFDYWFLSDLAIRMQEDILKKQYYSDGNKKWRVYYEAPKQVGINPYHWTRH